MKLRFCLFFLCSTLVAGLASANFDPKFSPSIKTERDVCGYANLPGAEFHFPSADRVLQHYGYVLWRDAASIISDPLPYERYIGRRGKLTGKVVYQHGIGWYEAIMQDCSYVYAEDASQYSNYRGLDHLKLHGKVVFDELTHVAGSLIGQELIVQAGGLEPRQRLYTESRSLSYPLQAGERLTVLGIDDHRYAHAKGVGPFFFRVQRQDSQVGLIKFNPKYVRTIEGPLPLQAALIQPADAIPMLRLSESLSQPEPKGFWVNLRERMRNWFLHFCFWC